MQRQIEIRSEHEIEPAAAEESFLSSTLAPTLTLTLALALALN